MDGTGGAPTGTGGADPPSAFYGLWPRMAEERPPAPRLTAVSSSAAAVPASRTGPALQPRE